MANLVSSPCTTSILCGCLAFAFLPYLTSIIDIYVLRALHRVRAQLPVRHLQHRHENFTRPYVGSKVNPLYRELSKFHSRALRGYGWVGHIYAQKYRGPGTQGFAFIYFLPSGMRSTQKVPGTPARYQTSFPIALKLFTKTFLVGSINRV